MDLSQISERQKNGILLVFVLCVLFAGWNINRLLSDQGLIGIELRKTPFDSTVKLEGVAVSGNMLRVKPGVYTLEVSRDGFYDKTITTAVTEDSDQNYIPITLAAATDEAKQLTETNEAYAYDHATSDAELIDPIIASLPIQNLIYSIRVDWDNLTADKPVNLLITASSGYRFGALNKIKELGFDVSNYTYTFTNYENPFK